MSDQILNAVEATSAQNCRNLWPDFGQKLIDAGMHSQISVHHAAQEFEWSPMSTRRMQYNHQFLRGIEAHPIGCIPPMDFATTFLGIFNHLLKRHMLIEFFEAFKSSANIASCPPFFSTLHCMTVRLRQENSVRLDLLIEI